MRIIFLNIWEGKLWKAMADFITESSANTDIFCFQEVPVSLNPKIQNVLPQFISVFDYTKDKNLKDNGQSIFVKKPLIMKDYQSIFFETRGRVNGEVGFLQKVVVVDDKDSFSLGNLQGKAIPGDKLDNDVRLTQSRKILESFKKDKTPKIIGGDFNLMPETESIKLFERAGYRNLIAEFGIKSTRNHLSWEQAEKQEKKMGWKFFGRQHFADYVFVSKDVKVNRFEVPYNEISDHLPQILDFEI